MRIKQQSNEFDSRLWTKPKATRIFHSIWQVWHRDTSQIYCYRGYECCFECESVRGIYWNGCGNRSKAARTETDACQVTMGSWQASCHGTWNSTIELIITKQNLQSYHLLEFYDAYKFIAKRNFTNCLRDSNSDLYSHLFFNHAPDDDCRYIDKCWNHKSIDINLLQKRSNICSINHSWLWISHQ